ncbi:MAG: NAD(P)/FAD-dependent oxidoreductase, partial [Gammaproteobacteria bacterium]|nr:NAD(P)/FAD-dependent oxidoreductase [Gammaproteobacteria bacterium]
RYASQPEILRYAQHVADRFYLHGDIQLNTNVVSAAFIEKSNLWELQTDDGDCFSARFLVMATGCLSQPNWPAIKGLDVFEGGLYHTGQWPQQDINFEGRKVGVLGTGSSAIQVIPQLAGQVESLTVFQRTANYAIPAHNRPLDADSIAKIKSDYTGLRARAKNTPRGVALLKPQRLAAEVSRDELIEDLEWRWQVGGLAFLEGFSDLTLNPDYNAIAAEFVREKIRTIVKDEETAELLCPANYIGAKRLCVDINYFETYNRENVELVDIRSNPMSAIRAKGVTLQDGFYELDDLVIATGFDAITGALLNINITGKDGRGLKQQWSHGPKSYLGLAMAEFPNLFTVTGPGSPSVLTNMLPSIEQHVDWIADCLEYMSGQNFSRIEASAEAQESWWAKVQEAASVTLRSKTATWYTGENIENKPHVFMPYVGGFHVYSEICKRVVAKGYEGFVFS